MLRVENLRKSYGKLQVLKGISFSLDSGFYALIGRNGAGKTTLLKCILGIERCQGRISVNGTDVTGMKRADIARLIGYVPQMGSQDIPLTVREFVEMGAYFRDGDVERALRIVDVDWDRRVDTLSGGEFQKVLIARAIVGEPPLLLLDEPANHLDMDNTFEIVEYLREYAREHTVISVFHDLNLLNYVDGVLVMVSGRVEFYDKAEDVPVEKIYGRVKTLYVDGMRFIVPNIQ